LNKYKIFKIIKKKYILWRYTDMKFAVKMYHCEVESKSNRDLGIAAFVIILTNLFVSLMGILQIISEFRIKNK